MFVFIRPRPVQPKCKICSKVGTDVLQRRSIQSSQEHQPRTWHLLGNSTKRSINVSLVKHPHFVPYSQCAWLKCIYVHNLMQFVQFCLCIPPQWIYNQTIIWLTFKGLTKLHYRHFIHIIHFMNSWRHLLILDFDSDTLISLTVFLTCSGCCKVVFLNPGNNSVLIHFICVVFWVFWCCWAARCTPFVPDW